MKVFVASLISATLGVAIPAYCQTIYRDSFESADLSGSSVFNWGGTNRTSLVKRDSDLGDLIVYNGTGRVEIQQGFDHQWRAQDGEISMRFRYPPGVNFAEQRFGLDSAYPEIWVSYWLKVPISFRHSSKSPSNNKLFTMWMDGYEGNGDGPTVVWEFWNNGSDGSNLAYRYLSSVTDGRLSTPHRQQTPFIQYPDDQGRWMQIVVHLNAATDASSNDGTIQLYRRWSSQSSFDLLHNDQNADIAIPSGGPNGWKAGYFMGWSNPAYEEDTEWLMDDVVFSRSSLIGDVTPVGPGDSGSCRPAQPPTIITH